MKQPKGRPRKPGALKRQERLDIRVSASEKQAFQLAAAKSQRDLSVWIRIQLHKAAADQGVTEISPPPTVTNGALHGDPEHG